MGRKRTFDLRGVRIWDAQRVTRLSLPPRLDFDDLAKRLADAWIPFMECHKCGRFAYCKFAEPYPTRPQLGRDIRCGVAVTALREFVCRTGPSLKGATPAQIQDFVDAAFFFTQYVYHSEVQVGVFLEPDILDWFAELAPAAFGIVTRQRENLNAMAGHLQNLQQFRASGAVLLVEGESERAFIERLKQTRLLWFLHLNVDVYAGKGNRRPARIQMMLDRYQRAGYQIFIAGDADGNPKEDTFRELASRVRLAETFAFSYDFESSIPPRMLWDGLLSIGMPISDDVAAFQRRIRGAGPIGPKLAAIYSLDLKPHKIRLAEAIGDALALEGNVWWQNKAFMKSELGAFLDFLRRVH